MEELKSLGEGELEAAEAYIRRLKRQDFAARDAVLLATAGSLSETESTEWLEAIEAGCERTDAGEW